MSEEAHCAYRERHMVNPLSLVMNSVPVGQVVPSDAILPLAELKRTALFEEVWRPHDMGHAAMVPLAAKGNFVSGLGLYGSERRGPYDGDELSLLSTLYPHMRRSLLLGFRLDGYKALQRADAQMRDRLTIGIVLLDRAQRVVLANAAARAMMAASAPLRLRRSTLAATVPAHAPRLGTLVQAALGGTPAATIGLPHPEDGRIITVTALSVRSRDVDRFGDLGMRDVGAMLVIRNPTLPLDVPAARLMDAYSLTAAEARVALSAASGATIPETAHRLNVSTSYCQGGENATTMHRCAITLPGDVTCDDGLHLMRAPTGQQRRRVQSRTMRSQRAIPCKMRSLIAPYGSLPGYSPMWR